jgi:hypothetical protein
VQPPSLKLLLQLLQHVLYYAVNGRIAELYRHGHPTTQPAAATAAAAAAGSTAVQRQQHGSGHMAAETSHMGVSGSRNGTGSPAGVLASALLALRGAFVGLFPVGRQYSAAETAALKQQVAGFLKRAQQQQQGEDRQVVQASADAEAAAAAAAVGDVSRLLLLVQRWLQPQPVAASAAASDDDDDEQADSSSSDGDEEVADEQQQQQRRAAAAVAVSQEQLQQAMLELGQDSGFSIAGLATLEQQLQARFGVQRFAQLGLGAESLLQLLQQQPQLLALLQGSSNTAAGGAGAAGADVAACDALAAVPLAAVLQVAAQAKACCGDMDEQGEMTYFCCCD